MAKTVTVIGWLVFMIGAAAILIGLAGIAMTSGIGAALEIMNPFNLVNFIAVAITLAPGIALISWGEKLSKRSLKASNFES